jgi:SpoVK/Ycf46/Vps4 family AAA+-type ATPase
VKCMCVVAVLMFVSILLAFPQSGPAFDALKLSKGSLAILRAVMTEVQNPNTEPRQGLVSKGTVCVFVGSDSRRKKRTAEALSSDLHTRVEYFDLGKITSKYIGETEANLGKLFDNAENTGHVLFFDDSTALFADRTEVRGDGDRFSNQVVDYLLDRCESYDGLVVLATNAKPPLKRALQKVGHKLDFDK